ncbi:MAG: carboxypeptidase regulatory-like domain-containing protein [Anaerolineae bacterium]
MIPWNKLPRQLQKYILVTVILSSAATTTAGCVPIVCDPVPPPTTARPPSPDFTPIICDPMPPPVATRPPSPTSTIVLSDPSPTPPTASPTATRSPSPDFTPIICDPMPPPTAVRSATPPFTPIICDPMPPPTAVHAAQRFEPRQLVSTVDTSQTGALVQGQVLDAQGKPIAGIQITAVLGQQHFYARTDAQGRYTLQLQQYGDYTAYVGDDQQDAIHLFIKQYDKDTLDWMMVQQTSQLPLPLAEIRLVEITPLSERTFGVDTPWPGARLRWSVSGGELSETEDTVTWHPPAAAGHYLLQVIADWGSQGLAVSATTLIVEDDGNISKA